MNGESLDQNLFQSMKINSLSNNPNNFNNLQFISMDLKNNNNNNININFDNIINDNQNNGQPTNILNNSENELFNFELDQSTESIMTSQSFSQQIPFDYNSKKNNINNINNLENRNNSGAFKGNQICLNDKNSNISLEEKLKQEYLKNNELKNYIEILKQTINNTLIQNKNIEIDKIKNLFRKDIKRK